MPRRLWLVLAFLGVLAVLALLWQGLALTEVITPEMLRGAVHRVVALGDAGWMPPVMILVYVLASLAVFPLSIVVAATGLMFGALWGFVYALAGTLLAAVATYWIGRASGRTLLLEHGGARLNALASKLAGRGVRTMIVVSLFPLAPFTLTNLVAGAFRIRFRDYLLGTLIGIAPGLLAMTVIGSELASLIRARNLDAALWTLVTITLALVGVAAIRHLAARRGRDTGAGS